MALLVSACGGSSHPCVVTGPPEVRLGTAPEDGIGFEAITDGEMVSLNHGAQQGFHVWTNIQARNVCFDQVKIKRTAKLVDTGEAIISSTDQLNLVKAADPTLAAAGWGEEPTSKTTFMCPNPLGLDVLDRAVVLHVQITDSRGRTAEDMHTVVPECPMNMYADACHLQCAPDLDGGSDL